MFLEQPSASDAEQMPQPLAARLNFLLAEPALNDLLLNGCDTTYADLGIGLLKVQNPFDNEAQLEQFARAAIASAGRHLDFASPAADATVGAEFFGMSAQATFRVHAVLASAITAKTLVSIRKHPFGGRALSEFVGASLELEVWLREMICRRENFLVSGATGAGKTTLLKALLAHAQGERIIAIEDSGELASLGMHGLSLQARQANTEGRGAVTLDFLLHQALRMRPDRLVLGEARGPELLTLLSALNTGHSGAAASIHANGISAVASRVELIGLQAGWQPQALKIAFANAVQWVLHVKRTQTGRRISEVAAVRLDGADLRFEPVADLDGLL